MSLKSKYRTKSELANGYNISTKTLRAWLIRIRFFTEFPEANLAKVLTNKHLNYIFNKLDPPEEPEETT